MHLAVKTAHYETNPQESLSDLVLSESACGLTSLRRLNVLVLYVVLNSEVCASVEMWLSC